MNFSALFVIVITSTLTNSYNVSIRRFPKNFKFGTASAAYQIEGGWNADGKGESVWDRATHEHPEKFSGDNGDIACDSYHKWEQDVYLLKDMGVNTYRFSIAWSRVLPTGFINQINPAGVTYYKNLIKALKENNIEPLITMHHWDIPQALEDIGGFLNPDIQDIFVNYARFLFDTFGNDVKDWVTFNEPKQTCLGGYGEGVLAPLVEGNGINEYKCAHNLIIAHAKAYKLYNEEYRAKQNGRVTMVIDTTWFEPASNSTDDIEAAERRLLFTYGWFAHPLVYGDYPAIMKDRIKYRSLLEGFNSSRLPTFTAEEKGYLKGSADYLTINIYTSSMVKAIPEPEIVPLKPNRDLDCGVETFQPDDWEPTVASWFKVVPWGARKLVKWISDTYGNPEIVVTENGYQDNGTVIHDMDTRGRYHKLYLSNIQDAMYKDGVNITGYMAWSLTDDFEWQFGYNALADDYIVSNRRFPANFKFGTASAAYQIEGGWDADGKGENIWDRSTHLHPELNSYQNGDVACDSYNKWEEDVELLKKMGVSTYRFSIAWSRVLPTGFVNSSNPAGIAYYKNLIKALKANNIEPLVTMYHWDHPTNIEDLGGFLNPQIQEWFVEYARFLFENFGDDVKDWVTFNEPKQTCEHGYGSGALAPNIYGNGIKDYQCAHNLILAHGKTYRMYEKEFKEKQGGKVTMVIDSNWFGPATDSAEDIEASERIMLFTYGWFGHPINFGDYPEIMKERIAQRSALEGFDSSRLPSFTEEEKQIINGTADYMCVNIYTSSLVNAIPEAEIVPLSPNTAWDIGVNIFQPADWEPTVTSWFKVYPLGARKIVKWISDTYGHPEIVVTENGYHDNGTVIHDLDTRGRYHKLYLSNLNDAIYEDGVNLVGYMAWALTDDFEWQYGYNIQLGFYQVNFTDPERPRTPKDSAAFYHKVVTTGCLVDECID